MTTQFRETIHRESGRLDHHVFAIYDENRVGYTAALTPREASEAREKFQSRGWTELKPRVQRKDAAA